VQSSTLQDREAKTLTRQLDQAQAKLEAAVSRLEQTAFHCEADAQKAIAAFQKQQAKSPFFQVTWTVHPEDQVEKRARRGRPKKDEQPVITRLYFPRHQCLERVSQTIEEEKKRLSTFILITNQMSRDALTDEELLRTYKGQSAAETRFRLLKSPQLVDDFFLKKPERIDALGIVVVMALLIYGILEYRVRKQMEKEKEPLRLAGNRKVFRPTGRALLYELAQLKILYIRQNGQVSRLLPDNIGESAARILRLAGYDLTLLVSDPVKALQK
jgi:transposase